MKSHFACAALRMPQKEEPPQRPNRFQQLEVCWSRRTIRATLWRASHQSWSRQKKRRNSSKQKYKGNLRRLPQQLSTSLGWKTYLWTRKVYNLKSLLLISRSLTSLSKGSMLNWETKYPMLTINTWKKHINTWRVLTRSRKPSSDWIKGRSK